MANLHFNRALELTQDNRLNEAIIELQAALELWDRNPKYHNLLGKVLARKGLFSRAIVQWEKGLELDTASATAYECIQRARRIEGFLPQQHSLAVFKRVLAVLALLSLIFLMGWFTQCSSRRTLQKQVQDLDKEKYRLELSLERMKGERMGLMALSQAPASKPEPAQTKGKTPKSSVSTQPSEEVLELSRQVGSLKEAVSQKDEQIERFKRMVAGAQQAEASASSRAEALTTKLIEWDRLLNERAQELKTQASRIRENELKNREYVSSLQRQVAELRSRLERSGVMPSDATATVSVQPTQEDTRGVEIKTEDDSDESQGETDVEIPPMELLNEFGELEDRATVPESATKEP